MSPFRPSKGSPPRTNTTESIRGKISAPMLMPSSEEEFPQRTPGIGIATTSGAEDEFPSLRIDQPSDELEEADERPSQFTASTNVDPEPTSASLPTTMPETLSVPVTNAERKSPESSQQQTHEGPVEHDYSTGAYADIQPSVEKSSFEQPQRRKSGFRFALSKLFGKKKNKRASTEQSKSGGSVQHRSAPIESRSTAEDVSAARKRTTSLPIDQYNRALRSHSPLVESVEQRTPGSVRNAIATMPLTRARGATTPGRIADGYWQSGAEWGLTPRPNSSRAKGSVKDHEEDAIGTAVTSGSHPNRRSRSLNHMREKSMAGHSTSRRRSDEIKYWRQSYDPTALSPMSLGRDMELQSQSEEQLFVDVPEQKETPQPPQPFNFGPLGEMAGMKITEKASLESRVSQIEDQLETLERKVTHLRHRASSSMVQLQDAPKSRSRVDINGSPVVDPGRDAKRSMMYQQKHNPQADTMPVLRSGKESLYESRPSTRDSDRSSPSHPFSDLSPPPALANKPPASSSHTSRASHHTERGPLTRLQTTTILSAPNNPPLPSPNTLDPRDSKCRPPTPSPSPSGSRHQATTRHDDEATTPAPPNYTTLLALIAAERSARLALERHVLTLQHQLHFVLSGAKAPRASLDDNLDASEPHRGIGRTEGALDQPAAGQRGRDARWAVQDDSESDEGQEGADDDFRTPNGEGEFGADEAGRDGAGGLKARTMSVGQMTLGRGVAINV